MNFGDKLPYRNIIEVPAVGNSANASVAMARLGLSSALLAYVGDDIHGKQCLKQLKKEYVDTKYIVTDKNLHTNYHFVLRYGAERTILIKHSDFKRNLKKELSGKKIPSLIYLSSIGEPPFSYYNDIARYVYTHNIKFVFQPGTRQIDIGYEKLKDIYKLTNIFTCNVEEARHILSLASHKNIKTLSVKNILQEMHKLGPKIVVITDGPKGAYAFDGRQVKNESYFIPIYPDPKPPVDRTGAGDAFASTFASAIMLDHDIKTALQWAGINSMSVVQYIGAQEGLLTQKKIQDFLKKAPKEYVARKM